MCTFISNTVKRLLSGHLTNLRKLFPVLAINLTSFMRSHLLSGRGHWLNLLIGKFYCILPLWNGHLVHDQEELSLALHKVSDLLQEIKLRGPKSQTTITDCFRFMLNVLAKLLMMWFTTKTCSPYEKHYKSDSQAWTSCDMQSLNFYSSQFVLLLLSTIKYHMFNFAF